MKQTYFFISMLLLVATLFQANDGLAQDYVHYATLTGHTSSVIIVKGLAFSPDGHTLASWGSREIILWNVTTGRRKAILAKHTRNVENVVFSPDGHTLASSGNAASLDSSIHLWNAISGVRLRTFTKDPEIGVNNLAFSPDGQVLAAGGFVSRYPNPSHGIIILWDTNTGQRKKVLTGHSRGVTSIAFSPDGQTIISGSYDDTIRLWNVVTGKNKKTLRHPGRGYLGVVLSPDGKTLASRMGQEIRLWDVNTYRHKATLTANNMEIWSIVFSPDSRTLAGGALFVYLWSASTGEHRATLSKGAPFAMRHIVFSPDGSTLASERLGSIDLWNVDTGVHLQTLRGKTPIFTPNGQMFASTSGSYDGTIRLWRVSAARPVDIDPFTPPKSPADQVYEKAIRSVMWIVNPDVGEGSGVLFDKKFGLAITNAHVAGQKNTIDVYFPAPNENGELIKNRNFYLTSKDVLKRLGYYTKGHVVARNEKTDLTIIRLDGLPETAREIDWDFTTPTTNAGELVYILGNPGGQKLWRWTLGEYLKDHEDFLHLQADVFGGNSGGPVLNKRGILIGIVARSDKHMNALAIPVRDMNRLLSESGLEHSRSRR